MSQSGLIKLDEVVRWVWYSKGWETLLLNSVLVMLVGVIKRQYFPSCLLESLAKQSGPASPVSFCFIAIYHYYHHLLSPCHRGVGNTSPDYTTLHYTLHTRGSFNCQQVTNMLQTVPTMILVLVPSASYS